MTPEDWQRVKPILDSALKLDSAYRPAFLNQACADPSLRHEIESLIAAHEGAGSDALNSTALLRSTIATGTRLGDFEILSLLGAGGMGEVYRARDLRLERDVAIKILPRFVSLDPERLRRFEQEAKAAAALNHPNILGVFQMGSYEDAPYLVSELLEGETVREQVKRGPVAQKKAVDYAVQIAHGLAAAHEKGIVHRDLKPENLFVTRDGRLKILDFGLAKLLRSESETQLTKQTLDTQPGAVLGTVGYMAPEQVRGLPADHRADIFAFGAILYEMLTGQRAFHKPTFADTMSAILNEDPPPVSQITANIPPAIARGVQRCLEKNPEQRFQSASDLAFALELSSDSGGAAARATTTTRPAAWKWMVGVAIGVALLAGGLLWWHSQPSRRLAEKDTIVIADFTNTTGDPVFDLTLNQGLAVQLGQSPYLSLLSEQQAQQTLKMMKQPSDARITPEIARDLCQRTGSAAVVSGSIASLGSQYVLGLKAVDCRSGKMLTENQFAASGKEQVLKTLTDAATKLREDLGESLNTVEKNDVPLDQATTSSLEALQSFSMGRRVFLTEQDFAKSALYFQRAIELDPKFAAAYYRLGYAYFNLGNLEAAKDSTRRAYELRDRVSERERLAIEAAYYRMVTGDRLKFRQVLELQAAASPRDSLPLYNLSRLYEDLGEHEKAFAISQRALDLYPEFSFSYDGVFVSLLRLNRLEEAKIVGRKAGEKHLDSSRLHLFIYQLAFVQGDSAEMANQTAWAQANQAADMLVIEAATEAYAGKNRKARELSRRATESFSRDDLWSLGAAFAGSGTREALLGNVAEAKGQALKAIALKTETRVRFLSALDMALCGESALAGSLAEELNRDFPEDTLVQTIFLPEIRAQLALNHKEPAKAIDVLRSTVPYEMGVDALMSAYLRGQAYLATHAGAEATTEFQKIIDHREIVQNSLIGALAHLQMGRAYTRLGAGAKARVAYQDFLMLWKNADPDIPILKEAKAEYGKLR